MTLNTIYCAGTLCCVRSVQSLTSLKVGGGGGPGGGGGGGGIGILSLCWHLSVWDKDKWLHRLRWDDTHWLLKSNTNTFHLAKMRNVFNCAASLIGSCAFKIQVRRKNTFSDEAVKVETTCSNTLTVVFLLSCSDPRTTNTSGLKT